MIYFRNDFSFIMSKGIRNLQIKEMENGQTQEVRGQNVGIGLDFIQSFKNFYTCNEEQIITGYPIDGAMGSSGGEPEVIGGLFT